jgi:dihydrofolate synthase/folylpolyglutamate synthase
VLATVRELPNPLPSAAIASGISNAASLTGLRGRLEEIHLPEFRGRLFLDVGHNPEALEAVRTFFANAGIRPIVVFGIMGDKDVRGALEIISGFASRLIAVHANTARALPSAELAEIASEFPMDTVDGHSVEEGLKKAMEMGSSEETILVSGSHYIVGESLQNFSRGAEVNMTAVTKPKLRNPARIS